MLTVFYDCYNILNKVYSEGSYLKQAMLKVKIDERNRSSVTKICYGVLEHDIFLTYRLKLLCDKTPKLIVRTVLKIATYSITFLNKPVYAVTDTAVELLQKLGKKGVSGFVNAVLRRYANTSFEEPTTYEEMLSVKYDYPLFAVKKIIDEYGKDAESIMGAPPEPICIRFSSTDGAAYLNEHGVNSTALPYQNVFFAKKFRRNRDYDNGLYTFQSVGSIAICEVAGSGEELLDCCAAPGGKSVLLSERYDRVVARELHEHRAELIKEYALRMKRTNIFVQTGDSTVFDPALGLFDTVLCDVPCSGFGVLKSNPDIKLKKEFANIVELNKIQLEILTNCSSYVKKGGRLIYSTCSLFACENCEIIRSFLSHDNRFMPEIISVKIPYINCDFGIQMLPNISYGSGFYVCALRRVV